jgi:hypothetical protein
MPNGEHEPPAGGSSEKEEKPAQESSSEKEEEARREEEKQREEKTEKRTILKTIRKAKEGIPTMIPRRLHQFLESHGVSKEEIGKMTPKEAFERAENIAKNLGWIKEGPPKKEATFKEVIEVLKETKRKLESAIDEKEKEILKKGVEELEEQKARFIEEAKETPYLRDLDEKVETFARLSERGQVLTRDLLLELERLVRDPEEILKEYPHLKGICQEYYREKIGEILGKKIPPKEKQEKWFREKLTVLRTLRLTPELITNNPTWIELTTAVPFAPPELQEEIKARLEIFRYALGFKTADGVESGIAGSSRLLMPHIGKALEVEEIREAYNLTEESSRITNVDIMERDKISKNEADRKLKEENPLYAGTKENKEKVLNKLALRLAVIQEQKDPEKLNEEKKKELQEKYRWAVEEADDIWRITFRSDQADVGMKGRGGQWYLNRLFHYDARIETKGFGYPSTRKYFYRPLLPVWIEDEAVLPQLTKEGKLQISETDIERLRLREKLRSGGLGEDEIKTLIKEIPFDGRGLMIQGLWEYQIDFLKLKGLKELDFELEEEPKPEEAPWEELFEEDKGKKDDSRIKRIKDGDGREISYLTFVKEGMKVRVALQWNEEKRRWEYANTIGIFNPQAKILAEVCKRVPEGYYGSYIGDRIIKAEATRKVLEDPEGPLAFPPGSKLEQTARQTIGELRGKIFDHLIPLREHKNKRRPGVYYQEDAWGDLLKGAIDCGLHEGKKIFETWEIWGARRADTLLTAAGDLLVINRAKEDEITREQLPIFRGVIHGRGARWLRSQVDLLTMPYRWGPMRMATLFEVIKRFFKGIFEGTPFEGMIK